MKTGLKAMPATFSIVACDLDAGEWGVAVQSRYFAVGAAVPYARAGVGAVATQAWFHPDHGRRALALLAEGQAAPAVLERLLAGDPARRVRQLAVVDARGQVAAWTGPDCIEWAGHRWGRHFSCQGNILAGPEVVSAMAEAFEGGGGRLADRLVAALRAGQGAGGDRRGKQSAALLVVREGTGFAGIGDRGVDIRVDDHPEPIEELARLLEVYRGTVWGQLAEGAVRLLERETVQFLQAILARAGAYRGETHGDLDAATRLALEEFARARGLEGEVLADQVGRGLFRALCEAYERAG